MHTKDIEALLAKANIAIGDRIKIEKENHLFEGVLLPQTEFGNPRALVIKLDSGYNIGIEVTPQTKITKVGRANENMIGKTSKKLLKLSFNPKNPPTSLVATGGTIASRIDYRTGGVYSVEDPREYLHNVPELADVIRFKNIVTPYTKMSEDTDPQDWIDLATAVHKELKTESRGVIVTHGTDTLHYSAAALSFFLRNIGKPVVLVGSQRSSDRGSSDAGLNLLCAAHVALGPFAEVGTCMHGSSSDEYCLFIRGTKVRKMHTSRRDAFRPINSLPLAKIYPDGRIEHIRKIYSKRTDEPGTLDAVFEPKTALVRVFPGADPDILEYYRGKKYKGIVIEGSALGHVPSFARKPWIPAVKKLVKDGIPVVVSTQCIYGRVNPDVYTNLRLLYHGAGAIPAHDMHTETAFVKLGWVLGHTTDMDEIRKRMKENVAGEYMRRTELEAFLN
ncbi:MAG: Glu-tRNA(Gln) amidotransferase subunit GatD [Nanoarchaeota archaeon]|nr:Glu-tRNA(Gln) amidotransferase subunit GatD [Nanoarchaeota archaeon]